MDEHNAAVSTIASKIRSFHERKQAFRIYHGSTNSTRQSQKTRDNIVDTSYLNHVLSIDKEGMTISVEPNVPMDRLVEATLHYGLVAPVVMELPGITVGGGFSGTSGESSSFRHGVFERTIQRIEMILANGDIVSASSTENADLFWGAASSFGTLGVITLLEIRLMESKPYVELTYQKLSSMDLAIKKIEEVTADKSIDYVDGIVFAKDRIVICSGRLTDGGEKGLKIQRFTRANDPWFYIHTEKITSKSSDNSVVELIPIVDYLFRYDRGGFWVARYAFKYFLTPFNRITRTIVNKFMHARVMYHALHQSGLAKSYTIQDVGVPYSAASEFLDWLETNFGHYPLWLCPLKQAGSGESQSIFGEKRYTASCEYILNFGVWGPGPSNRKEFVRANRELEQKVQHLQGLKCLYAHAYYTEDEFWSIYDKKDYDTLREKYHAAYLPNVYDKVKVDIEKEGRDPFGGIRPLAGLYGVYKAAVGGDYLLPKGALKKAVKEKPH